MNWTKEQQSAIDARGENILLAASAGSGKTAVLVERIIKLITDENNPIDVNRLLVLTYTKAAAGEMKNKISAAIEKKLEEFPNNEKLKHQRLLLSSSNISTVHSFCLEMLKANIHLTDIPMDFGLCSENDSAIILGDCINQVLSEYYERIDKLTAFRELVDGYGGRKSDSELKKILKNLYTFAVSLPDPIKWLNDSANEYKNVCLTHTINGTVWDREFKKIIRESMEHIEELMDAEFSYCEEYLDNFSEGTPHPYTTFFYAENERIKGVFDRVKKCLQLETENRYDEIAELFDSISFETLVRVSTKNCPEMKPIMARAKDVYRDTIKKEVKKLAGLISMSEQTMVERICINYPRIKVLKNLVIRIMRKFKREKFRKNLLDFNDLEHEMLDLICDRNGTLKETAFALRERYEEILIDEYQDTNYIQDAIFKAISRENSNIFMVGDIKQSIYMFRNAVPQLFLEKFESYGDERKADDGENGRLICLNKNFRSRSEVIDTANFVFENLMSKGLGSVEYDESARLIAGAVYPECGQGTMDSELLLISNDKESELGVSEAEAMATALKVRELVQNSYVTDKESGELRKTEYRDIVILIRNANSLAPTYEKAFAELGIPIHTGHGRTYLSSVEVQTVLSFLQIIDNPYQDIPLIAVMRSPIFVFTANELADIRAYKKQGYFYDALLEYAKDEDNANAEKVRGFIKEIMGLRVRFEFADIHSIIWHIYYTCNYFSLVGAMEDSALKQENLRLLYNIALDFENSRFEGLFGFMNYIDGLIENGRDLAAANEKSADSNTVTLMSIHQSKGLEFPVVLLSGISKKINFSDTTNAIIWNKNSGIAMDCYDPEINAKYPSITTQIAATAMKRDVLSEEMRLLYVALTRAKEKLIIIASEGTRTKQWKTAAFNREGRLLNAHKVKAGNMQDWVLSAMYRHPDAEIIRELGEVCEDVIDNKQRFNIRISECFEGNIVRGVLEAVKGSDDESDETLNVESMPENNDVSEGIDDAERREIKENLFKEYKYKILGDISTKVSVTELKRIKNEQMVSGGGVEFLESDLNLFDENSVLTDNSIDLKAETSRHSMAESIERIDGFTFNATSDISSTDIGTIVHFVMQHIDLSNADTIEKVDAQICDMVERGMLSRIQADVVKRDIISNFAKSDICRRMLDANMLKKEFGFYISMPVSEIYDIEDSEILEGESVLMQGIVDCFFEEGDEIVIVDYKTDKVGEGFLEEHSLRYKAQLDYYQTAVERIFEKSVKEKYIYYLDLGKSVEIK